MWLCFAPVVFSPLLSVCLAVLPVGAQLVSRAECLTPLCSFLPTLPLSFVEEVFLGHTQLYSGITPACQGTLCIAGDQPS